MHQISKPTADNHANSPELLRVAGEIAYQYAIDSQTHPVSRFRTPEQFLEELDLGLDVQGMPISSVIDALEQLVFATPKSTSTRFYNQLFSGRDPIATAADMLAPVLNTSLYTFKAAGPMALIEQIAIRKMAHKLGFPELGPEGVFTPGGSISNLVAMLIARNETHPAYRNEGPQGKCLTCYVSEDAHYSISKNAGIIGLGRNNVRRVPTDESGAINAVAMKSMVEEDAREGKIPCILIATSGTTVRGAFDPINQIADLAQEKGIWLHVDASFGGAAAMSPNHSHLLQGVDRADSVAWNPHKVMGIPLSAAAFITRESGFMRKSLDETADYLFQADDDQYNPGTRSIQCGRRNDALKVWAAWKHHGDTGYRDRIDHLMSLANHAKERIVADPQLVLACDPAYVNVCFEIKDKSSQAICDLLRERNEVLVGHAVVNGRRIIRVPFVNGDLTTDDVDDLIGFILDAASTLPDDQDKV